MARAGMGIAVVPDTAARACNLEGVAIIALTEPTTWRPLGFIRDERRGLGPAAALLMAFLQERTPQVWRTSS
jgi:DNA-binding transcriptional LysR family regulator